MRHVKIIVALTTALCVSGCWPEEKIVWSPDGSKAAVLAGDGLYICDAEANISNDSVEGIIAVDWLGDGSDALVAAREVKVATWEQARAILPEKDVAAAKRRAAELRAEVLAHEGEMGAFKPAGRSEYDMLAVVYLAAQKDEALFEKLGDKAGEIKRLKANVYVIQKYRIDALDVSAGNKILTTHAKIMNIHVSSNDRAIAFQTLRTRGNKDVLTLSVAPAGGGGAQLIAEDVAMGVDWTSTGRLVYIKGLGEKRYREASGDNKVGRLYITEVFDGHSEISDELHAEPVVTMVYNDATSLKNISGGCILFASKDVTLPVSTFELSRNDKESLFAVGRGEKDTVKSILDNEQLALLRERDFHPALFTVNPSGTKAAIMSDDWDVAVIDLDNGMVKIIDTGAVAEQDRLMALPNWRTDDELCFVVPPGSKYSSKRRPEVVLWADGETRCISKSWGDDVVESFVAKTRTTQPATAPAPAKDK